jgi:acetyltransferase-like isoleucine patch superfamily enzyme
VRTWVDEPMTRVALRGRLVRPYWSRRFAAFGPTSVLYRPGWVYGPGKIEIGDGVVALWGLWLAAERSTWGTPGPAIRIGDRVGIRPYCTISASESVVIEDDVVLSAFSTVIDSDHTWDGGAPNVVYNPAVTSPVSIGAGTWIGERVAVLRGACIGKRCVIGANSVVRGEIPDHSIAVGAPARVVGSTA